MNNYLPIFQKAIFVNSDTNLVTAHVSMFLNFHININKTTDFVTCIVKKC